MWAFSCSHASHVCFCDLDPINFIHQLDPDILNMYLDTKREVSRLRLSEVRTDRQTDRHALTDATEHTTNHTLIIITSTSL